MKAESCRQLFGVFRPLDMILRMQGYAILLLQAKV